MHPVKRLLVLGAGTAGTTLVNRLRPLLAVEEWQITVVEPSSDHLYQPGLLFVPFGKYRASDLVKPTRDLLVEGVDLVVGDVEMVDTDRDLVRLVDGRDLSYDQLVIATGTHPNPSMTPGLAGPAVGRTIHEFYTLDGAMKLRQALDRWPGGRLVVHVAEMPIKCPVAPLEFAFLADDWAREAGIRDRVEITYVTPLSGAFTKPVASSLLGKMLDERQIRLEADFYVEHVEPNVLVSYDERTVEFDLLVTVPVNTGADFVAASGLGDELNHVRVDPHTFLAEGTENVFALGDAAALPTSKAGSVAHFAVDVFVDNFLDHVAGRPMTRRFDGHANCFVESGAGRALLLDFNYDTEPLPGVYPYRMIGPFSLLHETRRNHLGKLAFRPIYWHMLLPGRHLPVPVEMSMAGKAVPDSHDDERKG